MFLLIDNISLLTDQQANDNHVVRWKNKNFTYDQKGIIIFSNIQNIQSINIKCYLRTFLLFKNLFNLKDNSLILRSTVRNNYRLAEPEIVSHEYMSGLSGITPPLIEEWPPLRKVTLSLIDEWKSVRKFKQQTWIISYIQNMNFMEDPGYGQMATIGNILQHMDTPFNPHAYNVKNGVRK